LSQLFVCPLLVAIQSSRPPFSCGDVHVLSVGEPHKGISGRRVYTTRTPEVTLYDVKNSPGRHKTGQQVELLPTFCFCPGASCWIECPMLRSSVRTGPFQGWRSGLRFSFREAALEGCVWCWAVDKCKIGLSWSIPNTEMTSSLRINEGCVYRPSCRPSGDCDVRVPVLPDLLPRSCTLWSQCRFSPVACQRCWSTLGLLGRRRFTHKEGVQNRCCWVCCAFTL
jgi:hypothetical protein